jgi:regulator of sirC expression with transglutaminase-like and TPR domain
MNKNNFRCHSYIVNGYIVIGYIAFGLALQFATNAAFAETSAHEAAIAEIEQLSRAKQIEASYFDMAIAATRIYDPTVDAASLRSQIDEMAKAAQVAWERAKSPEEKAATLSDILFKQFQFRNPRAPAPILTGMGILDTYALPGVLKGKSGYCEGLSTIHLLVAKQAKLPVSIINLPVHTMCRFDFDEKQIYIENTRQGTLRSAQFASAINDATKAAAGSNIYYSPLTKKQFLNLHVNALAYGLIMQPNGPQPLTMKQMVTLAECIERMDPKRPESLETAALIHFNAGNKIKAVELINRTVESAKTLGAPGWVHSHYRKMQQKYQAAN